MKVKCKRCGTEYDMPDIGVPVTMEDCPVCQDIVEIVEKLGYAPTSGDSV